jgi:hypothetical protein
MYHLFRGALRSGREFVCPLVDVPRNILGRAPNFIRNTIRLLADTTRQLFSLVPNPPAGSLPRFGRKENTKQSSDPGANDQPH